MKLKILILLTLLMGVSFSIDPFTFIPNDKRHHAKTAFYIDYTLEKVFKMELVDRLWTMGAITLAKGILDESTGGKMDIWDGVANFSGVGLRVLIDGVAVWITPKSVSMRLEF